MVSGKNYQISPFGRNDKALLLAAGHSTRMGTPKWQLRMPSGEYFAGYLYNRFREYGCHVLMVVNGDDFKSISSDDELKNIPLVLNSRPELGRFYSLRCGLEQLPDTSPCFVHNIDNPFVNPQLLHVLKSALGDNDYVLPEYKGKGGHPLLISPGMVQRILQQQEPWPDLRSFMGNFRGKRVPVEHPEILFNINTPGDYRRFRESEM
ncbi:MAG: hypothetical protein EA393_15080 [Bacteroidetes bacterium]|nr:MAG: hypothetical protein EA393_15080 [Bacteroidota bacterium]